jgi:hypothetical protein
MSEGSSVDLRLPIGMLFVLLAVVLVGHGVATRDDAAMYERSTGVNINLVWGGVMGVFGGVMLGLAKR